MHGSGLAGGESPLLPPMLSPTHATSQPMTPPTKDDVAGCRNPQLEPITPLQPPSMCSRVDVERNLAVIVMTPIK